MSLVRVRVRVACSFACACRLFVCVCVRVRRWQAEEDLAYMAKESQRNELEAKVMADVPGWKVGASVYNSQTIYAPPMVNDHSL